MTHNYNLTTLVFSTTWMGNCYAFDYFLGGRHVIIGSLAEKVISHIRLICLAQLSDSWSYWEGLNWVRIVTLNAEASLSSDAFYLFYHTACLCNAGIRGSSLITWATVQSAYLKTKVSGRFLTFEKNFFSIHICDAFKKQVIIYNCYYCHWNLKGENRTFIPKEWYKKVMIRFGQNKGPRLGLVDLLRGE